jgi:hypothetical protein
MLVGWLVCMLPFFDVLAHFPNLMLVCWLRCRGEGAFWVSGVGWGLVQGGSPTTLEQIQERVPRPWGLLDRAMMMGVKSVGSPEVEVEGSRRASTSSTDIFHIGLLE